MSLRRATRGSDRDEPQRDGFDCRCQPTFVGARLVVDASDCAGRGNLAERPACRATAIHALCGRDADAVLVRSGGIEHGYRDGAVALLVAAGRFVELVTDHDRVLAARARRDPLGAARIAAGRGEPVARIAAETGLIEGATRVSGYQNALR